MRQLALVSIALFVLSACGGSQSPSSTAASPPTEPGASPPAASEASAAAPKDARATDEGEDEAEEDIRSADPVKIEPGEDNEFQLRDSDTAGDAHGERPSQIEPTETDAAIRFFVIDKDKGPIEGIVIKLTASDGTTYYTGETDSKGYAEVLVPVGRKYQLEYLSLGRREISAKVPVPDEPNQNIKLTLRYKRHDRRQPKPNASAADEPRFVLKGVRFDTGKATIRRESYPRLDEVVEYMTHKKSARIRVSGHTDNVGDPKTNKALSEKRAEAVRQYLISKGIDGGRIEAVGYGDTRPIASNDTEEGRQKNRRIEAVEL